MSAASADNVGSLQPAPPARERHAYVDLFRGLLIAHMALDHASLIYNRQRPGEELAAVAPALPVDLWQFLTRFTGVPVAPGFFLMAGFMVALTSLSREGRGVAPAEVTRRLVIRGLVLLAVDTFIMGIPRLLMGGFYSFVVLSSIGAALILLAFLRNVSSKVLLPLALATLVLHPLLDLSAFPVAVRAILHDPVRTGTIRSLYPIIPWAAVVLLGFVVGRDAAGRPHPERRWLVFSAISLAVFLIVRFAGGFGNAYVPGPASEMGFWSFAKYPPDLAFLSWSFFVVFLALAGLRVLTRQGVPALLRVFVLYGRVPFFFYVVHFNLLGLTAMLIGRRLSRPLLPTTYLVWLGVLVVMAWPCAWYYRKKRDRPNVITRWF